MSSDLLRRSALDLAAAVRGGEVSSRELIAAHVEQLERLQPELRAVAVDRYEAALAEASAADARRARGEPLGPLHGVPITVKESLDVAGLPSCAGIAALAEERAEDDSPLVARLRAAGAIVVAKSNLAQLLWFIESDNPVYGRAANPWDLTRTPGGSSGGEAAIVSAFGAALGLGTDIGGSVRVPAHFCGVHTLKPTSGRLDARGCAEVRLFPGFEAVRGQAGPFARSVADLALAMKLLVDTGPAVPPWREPLPSVEGLRIGFWTDNGHFPAAPALRRAVEEAARALSDRGADVTPFDPPDAGHAFAVFTRLMTADGGAGLRRALRGGPRAPQLRRLLPILGLPRLARPPLAALLGLLRQPRAAAATLDSGAISADAFIRMTAERDRIRRDFLDRWQKQRIDALLCPPLATAAIRHGSSTEIVACQSHVALWNLLGLPAGVLAATRVREGEESDRPESWDLGDRRAREADAGSAGLPVGVQVVAAPFREDVVLGVMAALEEHFGAEEGYPPKVGPPIAG